MTRSIKMLAVGVRDLRWLAGVMLVGWTTAAAPAGSISVSFNADNTGSGLDVLSSGGSQDAGSFEVQDGSGTGATEGNTVATGDGPTLKLIGNAWKSIQLPAPFRDIVAGWTIDFEFKAETEAEVHGIGFVSNNSNISSGDSFKVFGTQGGFGDTTFDDYTLADGFKTYSIDVGSFMTGNFEFLQFIADDDASPGDQESYFRNVTITSPLVIPEPATAALGLLGLGALLTRRRRAG